MYVYLLKEDLDFGDRRREGFFRIIEWVEGSLCRYWVIECFFLFIEVWKLFFFFGWWSWLIRRNYLLLYWEIAMEILFFLEICYLGRFDYFKCWWLRWFFLSRVVRWGRLFLGVYRESRVCDKYIFYCACVCIISR